MTALKKKPAEHPAEQVLSLTVANKPTPMTSQQAQGQNIKAAAKENNQTQSGRTKRRAKKPARSLPELPALISLKRIKLLKVVNQTTTSAGPAGTASSQKQALALKDVREVGIQTDEIDYNNNLLKKVIETNEMTARTLSSIENFAKRLIAVKEQKVASAGSSQVDLNNSSTEENKENM